MSLLGHIAFNSMYKNNVAEKKLFDLISNLHFILFL